MELFDILDENGKKTGEVRSRDEVHRLGLWHGGVHLWIVSSKNELLIQRRALTKESQPGKWGGSVAGHISSGGNSISTAMREADEELGLQLKEDHLIHAFTVKQETTDHDGTYINNEFDQVYIVHQDVDISKLTLQKEEVSEVKWIPLAEFKLLGRQNHTDIVPIYFEYQKLINYLEAATSV